jgi:hypothetical protein
MGVVGETATRRWRQIYPAPSALDHLLPHSYGFVRRPPTRVNFSGVAAVGAHAPRITEGSRIRKVPSLDREKDLL